jgi:hypothetical protein
MDCQELRDFVNTLFDFECTFFAGAPASWHLPENITEHFNTGAH